MPDSLRLPFRLLDTELFCVLGVESLPAAKLHCLRAGKAADRISPKQVIENIEANVPARGAHRNESTINAGPQRQTCARATRFKLPLDRPAGPS